jgi:protease YdgD
MKKLFTTVALIATLNACGQGHSELSSPKVIIGHDDRVSVDATQGTWAPMGRLNVEFPNFSGHCTATLVGPKLILAAAHCLYSYDSSTGKYEKFTKAEFFPEYSVEPGPAKGKVVDFRVGSKKPDQESAKDWAVMKLDTDLGSKYGYYGVSGWSVDQINFSINVDLVGYSGDVSDGTTLSAHLGCSMDGEDPGLKGTLRHTCDTTGGASGASLIYWNAEGVGYVAGIHLGTHDSIYNNAVPTDKAYDAVVELW